MKGEECQQIAAALQEITQRLDAAERRIEKLTADRTGRPSRSPMQSQSPRQSISSPSGPQSS